MKRSEESRARRGGAWAATEASALREAILELLRQAKIPTDYFDVSPVFNVALDGKRFIGLEVEQSRSSLKQIGPIATETDVLRGLALLRENLPRIFAERYPDLELGGPAPTRAYYEHPTPRGLQWSSRPKGT